MVPMAVGKDDALHGSHVEPETIDVAFKHRDVGSGIEQQRVRRVATPGRDGARQPVRRAAQAVPRQALQTALPEPRHFIFDVVRHRGQAVGYVVDQDQDFDPVGGGELEFRHGALLVGVRDEGYRGSRSFVPKTSPMHRPTILVQLHVW